MFPGKGKPSVLAHLYEVTRNWSSKATAAPCEFVKSNTDEGRRGRHRGCRELLLADEVLQQLTRVAGGEGLMAGQPHERTRTSLYPRANYRSDKGTHVANN